MIMKYSSFEKVMDRPEDEEPKPKPVKEPKPAGTPKIKPADKRD